MVIFKSYDGNRKVDNLFINEEGNFITKVDDAYEEVSTDALESGEFNGTKYDVDNLDGKNKYQMHVADMDKPDEAKEKQLEEGAMDAVELFHLDKADILEAKGEVKDAEDVREATDKAKKEAKKESNDNTFKMIMGIIALVGGIIAATSSGGGQKHKVVGQPSYNPNQGGYGGSYGHHHPMPRAPQYIPGVPGGGDRYGYNTGTHQQIALRDAQMMFGPL